MAEDKEKNPTLKFKDIKAGKSVKLKLDCSKPIASGEGQYGPWYLWVAFVENFDVHEGTSKSEKLVKDYSGKVIFFPTSKINKELINICNDNRDVEIEVTKTFEEGEDGKPITKYGIEKLSDGTPAKASSSPLTPTETKLIDEIREFLNDGHKIDFETFVKVTNEPQYKNSISVERAKELYERL